jgi:hypothetical protein
MQGALKIAITDAPIDADNVKAVNIIITNVEGNQNGKWKAFRNFETPVGVNLLAYTGGKSILLIDQYVSPGEFSSLRLSLNIANRNNSLIINPQSNITFKDGTSSPIYMAEGKNPEVIIEKNLGISSRGFIDLTLDFDLRKSIRLNQNGEYIIDPFVRVVETGKSGQIKGSILNASTPDNIVGYAYKNGTFNSSELAETADKVSFYNAITAVSIKSKAFTMAFLESGDYEIVFVEHDGDGKALKMVGMLKSITVASGEQSDIDIDFEKLNPS